MKTAIPDEAQIRETAYLIWLDEGQPQGCDQDHWLRAVDALSAPIAKTKPARKVTAKSRTSSTAKKKAPKAKAKAKSAAK